MRLLFTRTGNCSTMHAGIFVLAGRGDGKSKFFMPLSSFRCTLPASHVLCVAMIWQRLSTVHIGEVVKGVETRSR